MHRAHVRCGCLATIVGATWQGSVLMGCNGVLWIAAHNPPFCTAFQA